MNAAASKSHTEKKKVARRERASHAEKKEVSCTEKEQHSSLPPPLPCCPGGALPGRAP
jgi:hypothetical protein